METSIAIILGLAWMLPPALRTWRMGKFYQLEEYKTARYWAWLSGKRSRWFPRQPALMMLVGVLASALMQVIRADSPVFHFLIWLIVAGIVCLPEPVKEVKKVFVRTPRAMRMMILALALDCAVVLLWSITLINAQAPQMLSGIAIIGFIIFLLSPLALPLANLLLFPLEESNRRKFKRQARQRLSASGAVTIGITGSYGKTSTKTYLQHILSAKFKTYATPKSYNTELGVSRAINEDLDSAHQYFIAEMGAYVPTEIQRICQLTDPKISIVTAVGPMHLERFGTLENIVQAKYEIVEGLPPDGVAVFNADDPLVRGMAERGYPQTRILVSSTGLAEAQIWAENITQTLQGLSFEVLDRQSQERSKFKTTLIGLHNVTNILLAAAVARHVGMSWAEIAAGVATLESAEHRLRVNVLPNGILILDDAYSANPVGAASALEALALHQSGRRIVITPGMVELGDLQEAENFKLGQKIAAHATDIVLVGVEQTQALQKGIAQSDFDPTRLLVTETFDAAREWFQAQVMAGDAVLFLNDLPDTYL